MDTWIYENDKSISTQEMLPSRVLHVQMMPCWDTSVLVCGCPIRRQTIGRMFPSQTFCLIQT